MTPSASITISVDEACSLLECKKETLFAELRTGNLPGLQYGKGWIIPREAFIHRLNQAALQAAEYRRGQDQKPLLRPGRRGNLVKLPQSLSKVRAPE